LVGFQSLDRVGMDRQGFRKSGTFRVSDQKRKSRSEYPWATDCKAKNCISTMSVLRRYHVGATSVD
jgi:hypothetical protein